MRSAMNVKQQRWPWEQERASACVEEALVLAQRAALVQTAKAGHYYEGHCDDQDKR